jgi:anaerobic ribonucleoside-triphosphate reductase activating protein
MIRYIGYSRFDIANGPGIRVSIFLSGCSFKCKGCWSATAQNPRMGDPFTTDTIRMVLDDCAQTGVAGLSILGGEPFENIDATRELVRAFRAKFGNTKTIWVWSGFYLHEILADSRKIAVLKYVDVLVDGRFILEQRDTSLRFRGSRNQSVLDAPRSIRASEAVWWEGIKPGQ